MALIKCLGCGANISDKAIVCPKCGRKNLVENKSDKDSLKEKPISNSEVKSFNLKYIVGAIFISLLSVFLLAYLSDDNSNDGENTETTRIDFTHNFQSDFINLGIINSNSSTKNSFFYDSSKTKFEVVAQCGKDNPFLKIYSNSNLYPTDFNNQRDRKIFTNLCDATSYSNKIIMNPWEKYGSVYRTIQLRNNNEKEEILFWCSEGKFVDGFNAEEYDRRKVYDPYKTIPSLEQLKIYLARNVCTPYDLR